MGVLSKMTGHRDEAISAATQNSIAAHYVPPLDQISKPSKQNRPLE